MALRASDWYLAQLRPNSAQIALRNLTRQGFAIFHPIQVTTSRRGRAFVTQKAPLFPGYLFVGLGPDAAPLRAVNSTYGVSRLVSFGTTPTPVPRALISELAARCDAESALRELAPGDPVRLTTGPFADFVASVQQIAPDQRVWVLLDILGRATRVAIPRAELRRA